MVDRVFIGNHGGTFKMRVSKPGHDAKTASVNNLIIHEDMRPLIPVATGTVSIGAGGSGGPAVVTRSLGMTFDFPPKIVLRNNLNTLPSDALSYYASLDLDTGTLRIMNQASSAMIVRYTIFAPI